MIRSSRRYTAATACASHARARHARAKTGARTGRANVRSASRCGRTRSIRMRHCVAVENATQ
eukprot:871426-Lingulodinium_polyedra.AAC.1